MLLQNNRLHENRFLSFLQTACNGATPTTSLPVQFLRTGVVLLVTLLSVPTFFIASWLIEHTFYSVTAFGWDAFGELALPLGACLFAAIVFVSRNPMHALLSLLGVFFATVLLYLTAGIAFVGLVFLIIYVGAVAVLFLFVIMLLNVKSLTPTDTLIQHFSQGFVIASTALLMQQLHQIVVAALNRAMSNGFLRDAAVEPTTGDAILLYVRFRAADIHALTGLYTTHSILFMLTTVILLAALLGAIILATVTTERATAIADIRAYPANQAIALFVPTFMPILVGGYYFIDDFLENPCGLIYFTYHLIRITDPGSAADLLRGKRDHFFNIARDERIRQSNKLSVDRRRPRYDRRQALATQLFIKNYLQPKAARKVRCNQRLYRNSVFALMSRRLSATKARKVCQHPRLFRIYAASALQLLFLRVARRRDGSRVIRQRWTWHWRRDRATWLPRVGQLESVSRVPELFSEKEIEFWRKGLRDLNLEYEVERQKQRDYLKKLKPIVFYRKKFANKQRLKIYSASSESILLRTPPRVRKLFFRLELLPALHYWAWRVRVACTFFFIFLIIVPIFASILYFFVVDHDILWLDLTRVYHRTVDLLIMWRDGTYAGPIGHAGALVHAIAGIFLLPAAVIAVTLTYPTYILIIVALLTYDSVFAHGSELSDAEYHEARCNYWRKRAADRIAVRDAAIAAADLKRRQQHPDKGRKDLSWPCWPLLVVTNQNEQITSKYSGLAPTLYDKAVTTLNWLLTPVVKIFEQVYNIFSSIQNMQAYRCLSAWVRSYLPNDAITCCTEVIRRVAQQSWSFWCNAIWPQLVSGLDAVAFEPTLMRILSIHYGFAYSVYTFVVLFAAAFYCLASLALRLHWDFTYRNLPSRKAPACRYVICLLISVYLFLVYYRDTLPLHTILGLSSGYDFMAMYTVGDQLRMNFILTTYWIWVNLSIFVLWMLHWTGSSRERPLWELLRPLTLRSTFNYWAKGTDLFAQDDLLTFEQELSEFFSPEEALAETAATAAYLSARTSSKKQEKCRHHNLVQHTYAPNYYDPHSTELVRTHNNGMDHPAFITEKHRKNAFYSA